MKYLLLITSILSVSLLSCREGWTDESKKDYIETCKEGAGGWTTDGQALDKYCDCALQKTMQHYASIEAVIENADSTQLAAELSGCRAEVFGKK